ncbi:hypothetical protein LINGRAHAP2_LOCUS4092, partial [Linum grandiflorum]
IQSTSNQPYKLRIGIIAYTLHHNQEPKKNLAYHTIQRRKSKEEEHHYHTKGE